MCSKKSCILHLLQGGLRTSPSVSSSYVWEVVLRMRTHHCRVAFSPLRERGDRETARERPPLLEVPIVSYMRDRSVSILNFAQL
jgi:hypothetical protein